MIDYRVDSHLLNLENQLQTHFTNLLEDEGSHWMMKSRIDWVSLGDRNNYFFHISALNRRRRNKITQILDIKQNWISDLFLI